MTNIFVILLLATVGVPIIIDTVASTPHIAHRLHRAFKYTVTIVVIAMLILLYAPLYHLVQGMLDGGL